MSIRSHRAVRIAMAALAAAATLLATGGAVAPRADEPAQDGYVCPPCGCSADGKVSNEPGSCNNGRATTSMGFYTPLQQARFQLDDTFNRLEAFTDAQVPNRARFQTEMRVFAGYSYLLLGEGMCEMTIDNGPKMTKAEVWKIAESRFTVCSRA